VVANVFYAGVRGSSAMLAAVAGLVGVSPALANSSANSADIAAPLRAAQQAKPSGLGNADEKFQQLFASWQAEEKTGVPSLAAVADAADMASAGRPKSLVAAPVAMPRMVGSIGFPSRVSIPSRMPVEGVRLSSDFGMRSHPVLGGRRAHKGIDLAGPTGTPIHATADGVISKAEWFSSYGLYVSIEHGGDLQTRYGHMSRLNVGSGQRVQKGDVIGYIGSTGRSTGPHLHYEVRIAGQAVNPIPYMQSDDYRRSADTGGQAAISAAR
jgi:murein DD-endopeptidase MepM/ murein hydrolase activator NlpD